MTAINYLDMAAEYRCLWGKVGGVVVFYDGKIQSWYAALPEAAAWMPGCLALDTDSQMWVATGGNDQDGAARWEQLP